MSLDPKYSQALTVCAASLAIKIGVLHLLTARERLLTGRFAQEQDANHWYGGLLLILLGCVKGTELGGDAFIQRAERTAKANAENEPFFLALATIAGLTQAVPTATATTLVQVYTAARYGHTVSYLCGEKLNTAFRTTTFVTGLGATFVLAGMSLVNKK